MISGSTELSESYEIGGATFAAFQSSFFFPCLLPFWDETGVEVPEAFDSAKELALCPNGKPQAVEGFTCHP